MQQSDPNQTLKKGRDLKVGDIIAPWGALYAMDNRWAVINGIHQYPALVFKASTFLEMVPHGQNGFRASQMRLEPDDYYIIKIKN